MRTLVQELQEEREELVYLAWSRKDCAPHTQNHHPMYWLERKHCERLIEIEEKLQYLDVRNPPDDEIGVPY